MFISHDTSLGHSWLAQGWTPALMLLPPLADQEPIRLRFKLQILNSENQRPLSVGGGYLDWKVLQGLVLINRQQVNRLLLRVNRKRRKAGVQLAEDYRWALNTHGTQERSTDKHSCFSEAPWGWDLFLSLGFSKVFLHPFNHLLSKYEWISVLCSGLNWD